MKKTCNYIWLLKPNVNFQKLLLTMKIVTMLLFCGLALPAYSLAAEKLSGSNTPGTVVDQQQIKVSGTITDEANNQPLPGVNIQVKGTVNGAISDANGNYVLTVNDPQATLIFSFIGYVSKEVPLDGKISVNVTLAAEVSQLGEVVVIGYGTAKKATLTGSISSVNGDNLKQSPTTNLTNSLIGRLPGITAI